MTEPTLPAWADALRARYLSGASALFVLHGNVHDLVPCEGRWVPLREFLAWMLGRSKEIVAFYDVASGLTFAGRGMEKPFRMAVNARRLLEGRAELPIGLPRDPYRLFPFVETFLQDPGQHGAFVIEFADTVVPNGDVSFMGEQDRAMRVTVQRWSFDPGVLATDNIIVLVTENFASLDRMVRAAPRLSAIEIPLPGKKERKAYLDSLKADLGGFGVGIDRLADATAGLSNFQLDNLVREVRQAGGKVTLERVNELKRRSIEQECFGLVEFVESQHDFSVVGGLEPIKAALMRVVESMRRGQKERVPMGILIVGPMGTGKSFMMEAFANECGMTTLKLKNFRDKWVGSTEANLEKILGVIHAMGNVLVVIDEGDRSIGGQGQGDADGGVDSRVIARLKEFMSDTSHRGSIIFAMMTNRPDKLDADMKRPGRFDLKLPFFPPQTEVERQAIVQALLRKNRIKNKLVDWATLSERLAGMTGAEIEALLLSALGFAEERGADVVTDEDVHAAITDYIPSQDQAMMRYMELLAVFEASSRRLLPEKYRTVATEELNAELRLQQQRLLRP